MRAALERLEARLGARLPGAEALLAAVVVRRLEPRASAFGLDEPCRRIFVVDSGLLKQLYLKDDGSEWIKSFTGAGDAFACPFALAPGGRTTFASVAIEPSVVESIDFAAIEALAAEDAAWQRAVRVGFQALAERKLRREQDLLMLTARELYRKFAAEAPLLARRVPQKDLAAYLGVTAVGLNRIIRSGGAARRPAARARPPSTRGAS
jgi:CRP-like cAMP-binding protein